MIVSYAKLMLRFIALLATQLLLIDHLHLSPYIYPNIFLLFFLTLPANIKPVSILIIGFLGGLILDMFNDSPGFNSTAIVLMSYARILYIRNFMHTDISQSGIEPGLISAGYRWFITYSVFMLSVYHLTFSFIESFNFHYIAVNLFSSLLSSMASLVLVILFQVLFFRTKPVSA